MGSSSASKQYIRSFVAHGTALPEFLPSIPVDVGWVHKLIRCLADVARSRDIQVASANVVLMQHPTILRLCPEHGHGGWANLGAENGNYRQSLNSTPVISWHNMAASYIPRMESVRRVSHYTCKPHSSEVRLEIRAASILQSQQHPELHAHALTTKEALM
jgi:hypothetical protein